MKRVENLSEALTILITTAQVAYKANIFTEMSDAWQIMEAINFIDELSKKTQEAVQAQSETILQADI